MNGRRTHTLLLAALLWLLGTGLAAALETSEDPAEARVRAIAKNLRCAVCQNQSVYDSNSDLARDMLKVIRDKVRAGEDDAAINAYFFQRYGDYIYLEPTRQGMNWLLWLGPFVGLLAGGAALWGAMRRWGGRRGRGGDERQHGESGGAQSGATAGETPDAPPTPPDPAMQQRIRKELERVEM